MKRKIVELNEKGEVISTWNSVAECSKKEKLDSGNLSKICNAKLSLYKNRNFKFYDQFNK